MELDRRTVLGALGLAATGMPAGMVFGAEPGKLTFITPQRLLISFAEVMVAQGNGRFGAHGLDVTVVGGSSAPQAMQQVLAAQAEVCRTGGITLVNAVAKGMPMRSFGTIAHGSIFFVVSAKSNPVNSPRDFIGGVIGVISQGGPADATLDAMLMSENIDPKQIVRQVVPDNAGSFGLVAAGRVKAFIASVESVERARAAGADMIAFNTQKYMPLPGQIYGATNDVIATREADLVAFIKGVKEAIDDIVADATLEHTFAVLEKFNVEGLDNRATATAVLRANQETWLSAGPENVLRNVPENWSRGVALAAKAGFGQFVPNDQLFTNAIVDKALGPKA
jgi:ABC-type nitrate/sulfonate/bicarbonate transport system substrate-binding protein